MGRIWHLNMNFLFHPISSLNLLVAMLVTGKLTLWLSIVFFIFLSLNYKKLSFQDLDRKVYTWAQSTGDNFFKSHVEDLAIFGNAIFHILYCIVVVLIFFIFAHNKIAGLGLIFTLIFSWALNRLAKLIYKRERPRNISSNIKRRLSYCFPSGHVMASIPIYFFSAIILQGLIPFISWYLLAFLISLVVIMTRIYLNHHYFTDVLGGIALGIVSFHISVWFYFWLGLVL